MQIKNSPNLVGVASDLTEKQMGCNMQIRLLTFVPEDKEI